MQTKTLTVFDLPISSCGCGHFDLRTNGVELSVGFQNGSVFAGSLKFDWVIAYRFRNEMHSLGFAEGSYDCLVEIVESDWLSELKRIEPDRIQYSAQESKHFAVYLSNNGYLEVIASSVELATP